MSNLTKKITKTIFVFLCLFSLSLSQFSSLVHAADEPSPWYSQSITEWQSKVYDENISPQNEIFGERYTAAQVRWVIYSLVTLPLHLDDKTGKVIACAMSGFSGETATDPIECGQVIIEKLEELKPTLEKIIGNSEESQDFKMATVFDYRKRSMSGIGYVVSKVEKYKLIPEAQAQGFGYTALNPIQKYWQGSRNIAYALIVFVTIIFAFMIMFRIKLNPQTVISVQSAIPKIITALVLATFSYAIAGFLIDLMYVVAGLMASLIGMAGFTVIDNVSGFGSIYNSIMPPNTTGLYFLIRMIIYDFLFLVAIAISCLAMLTTGNFSIQGGLLAILMLLLVIWIFILSLIYTVKANWVLIKNLISIYVSIIFAPLQLVAGALVPSIGFGAWATKLFVELLVYPVTGVFMFFAYRLLWTSMWFSLQVMAEQNWAFQVLEYLGTFDIASLTMGSWKWDGNVIWVPEIIGFGESMSPLIILLMSFGIIVAIPKVVDILKSALMGGKFDYGSAIGEAMAPVKAPLGWAGGMASGIFQREVGYPFAQQVAHRAITKFNLSENSFVGGIAHSVASDLQQQGTKAGASFEVRRPGQRK